MNPIIIIPARLGSTRLPGKVLMDICGAPMIVQVLRRAWEADVGPVVVACGEAQIAEAVRAAGGASVLTNPALPSGSDRVFAALEMVDPDGRHDVVVNLQGDLPTMPPRYLTAVLAPLRAPGFDIATLVAPAGDEAGLDSVVKCACAFAEGEAVAPALYFSRAMVPWGPGPLWHHVGIYAYRRQALADFVALPPSALEQREGLEQLRALEAGMRMGVARVEAAPFGVDTPADLAHARSVLQ